MTADEPAADRRPQKRRPDRREHAADGGPVDDERGLGNEERCRRRRYERARVFGLGSQRKSDRDEQHGRAGVEAEKLHPRLASDPRENEGDADP